MLHVRTRVTTVALTGGAIAALALGASANAGGSAGDPATWTSVSAAAKATGVTVPNVLSPQLTETVVAQGAMRLDGGTANVPYYGYDGDFPALLPAPGDVPAAGHLVEASKTEPDKNTYLVLNGVKGADPAYRYGRHFLFQGHETGTTGYLTRVNLDADAAHRVTLLATTDVDGNPLPLYDGSTWNPFARHLLLSSEEGTDGGIWQATLDYPSQVQDVSSVFGRAGYEGIQTDAAGNVWIVEDAGGATIPGSKVKLPNSFVYRFVPVDKTDLTKGGTLQALQVISRLTGQPITFQPIDAAHPNGNALSADQKDLHVYGNTFQTRWVTVNDTATDPSGAPFDANALAKAAGATPFKRPENGQFRPGTGFRQFLFAETGDTDATSIANDDYGGWTTVFSLSQPSPSANTGVLRMLYKGDEAHAGFDNVTFLDATHVAFVEDAGDTLHTQRGALDTAYVLDVTHNYTDGAQPVRFIAEGRDPSATIDSALGAFTGFQNEGDNEITGIHASNGDPTARGLLGAQVPHLFKDGWRLFWTQQHGDNETWEVLPAG